VMPDRIEAGTYLCAPALAGGDVTVGPIQADAMRPILDKLREAGLQLSVVPLAGPNPHGFSTVRIESDGGGLRSFELTTAPHPGFPTDMQAQLMSVAACAQGESVIKETIFENRFLHAAELNRMGAEISIAGLDTAHVRGVPRLQGTTVTASDLRASAALVLAGLGAEGTTIIRRVYHLFRGYEALEEKFRAIGAVLRREQADLPG